jgi:hypothetical protein
MPGAAVRRSYPRDRRLRISAGLQPFLRRSARTELEGANSRGEARDYGVTRFTERPIRRVADRRRGAAQDIGSDLYRGHGRHRLEAVG